MRADTLTLKLDDPTARGGHIVRRFTDVTYTRTWNGVQVTPADGGVQFFDNLDIVGFETFTARPDPREEHRS